MMGKLGKVEKECVPAAQLKAVRLHLVSAFVAFLLTL